MLRTWDQATSLTVYHFPEPPISQSEPAPVVTHNVDWRAVELPEYEGKLAFVIDNVFSLEDCQKLLAAGELSAPWTPAAVNAGPEDTEGAVLPDYRKSSRILLDNQELADEILGKLRPHLQGDLHNAPSSRFWQFDQGSLPKGRALGTRIQLTRLNERLRYLKYLPGDFFDEHCDAGKCFGLLSIYGGQLRRRSKFSDPVYYTPDGSEMSGLTLQVYLNGSPETLSGGATRFKSDETPNVVVDVDPRVGRVLIFEQGTLLHTGEKVLEGEKYVVRTDLMYRRVSS
ncbi:hypothetical protein FRC05_002752 [Tulasnella sp. 425]|nr:hypothetical protein FRC05_002752 [Tulasnella sp. 425]